MRLATALLLLMLPCAARAQAFEPPALLAESREGPMAPFVLYPRLGLAGSASAALLVWTEQRLSPDPFQVQILGLRLDASGAGPLELVGGIADPLPGDGPAALLDPAGRVHLVHATRAGGVGLLLHRTTDLSLGSGAAVLLERSPAPFSQPRVAALPGGRLAVAYRRGEELLYREVPSAAPPLVLAARAAGFDLAASGSTAFVAWARSEAGAGGRLEGRIELVELRAGTVAARAALAASPAPVSGLALAASPAGGVAAAWADDRFSVPQLVNTEIFLAERGADGQWLPERRMSWTLAESLAPVLLYDRAGRLHLAWQDAAFGAFEVFHRTADEEAGVNVVSARDGRHSLTPAMALAAGRVTLVWRDAAEGRADLYVARQAGTAP
jgi:hypothetical protein